MDGYGSWMKVIPKGKVTRKKEVRQLLFRRRAQSPLPRRSILLNIGFDGFKTRATTRSNSCKVRRGSSNKLHAAPLKPGTRLRVIFSSRRGCFASRAMLELRSNISSSFTFLSREKDCDIWRWKNNYLSQAWLGLESLPPSLSFPLKESEKKLELRFISFLKRVQGFSLFAIAKQRG